MILLALTPVKTQIGSNYADIARYLLLRSALRASAFCSLPLGLALWGASSRATLFKLGLALTVFLDMFLANHRLNAPVSKEYFELASAGQKIPG